MESPGGVACRCLGEAVLEGGRGGKEQVGSGGPMGSLEVEHAWNTPGLGTLRGSKRGCTTGEFLKDIGDLCMEGFRVGLGSEAQEGANNGVPGMERVPPPNPVVSMVGVSWLQLDVLTREVERGLSGLSWLDGFAQLCPKV